MHPKEIISNPQNMIIFTEIFSFKILLSKREVFFPFEKMSRLIFFPINLNIGLIIYKTQEPESNSNTD